VPRRQLTTAATFRTPGSGALQRSSSRRLPSAATQQLQLQEEHGSGRATGLVPRVQQQLAALSQLLSVQPGELKQHDR
jgi:hypothetical protein